MKTRKNYQTPGVLKDVSVQLERDFLKGSIVDDSLMVISDGQKVNDIDAGSEDFDWNNRWEWE